MSEQKRGETFVMKGEAPSKAPESSITFSTFLIGLASSALIHLGEAPNPETGRAERDLLLARQSLDLLGMLHDKTRGNLTSEEQQLFDNLLADLRLRFVGASKR
jgi:hypothetical protein